MKIARTLFLFVAALGLASLAYAADEGQTVTVSGKIACAKCTLHTEGAKECQSVLVAEKDGKTTEYYLEANAVAKAHHPCKGETAATVTGVVTEKDGKLWLAATKIEKS